MKKLPYSYFCNHLTVVEGITWRGEDHRARIVVRGLKKEPFNGRLDVKINNQPRAFTEKNIEDFIRIFVPSLGRLLLNEIQGPISLVPIPNSEMAVGVNGSFRTVELAQMVAEGYGKDAVVVPAIRWIKPRAKAHKKKEHRTPDMFQPLMRLVEKPQSKIVIFDDVLTSGSQMIAATRLLTDAGYDVARGMVVAQAGKEQVEKPIQWRNSELNIANGFLDLDF